MFYFYAMPFVLADDGIMYEAFESFEFEGRTNNGIRVTYNDGIGVSPKDEYILFYDSETMQMTWLAYTVTYFDSEVKEKQENLSPKYGWIRYNDWKDFNGVVLPNSLTWYSSEDNKPTAIRSTRYFKNVKISEEIMDKSTFEKTEESIIIEQ